MLNTFICQLLLGCAAEPSGSNECDTHIARYLSFRLYCYKPRRRQSPTLFPRDVILYCYIHRFSWKKTGPIVISSYLCFDSYELHENFQKYIHRRCCLLWIVSSWI